jgi:hypothetical protein
MSGAKDIDLPDLVIGIVDDTRELVEAQVSTLRADLGDRLGDIGTAIRSWLVAVCVAIVTTVLLGLAIAATLQWLGVPWFGALWIVTAIAMSTVVALVVRARRSGRKAIAKTSEGDN